MTTSIEINTIEAINAAHAAHLARVAAKPQHVARALINATRVATMEAVKDGRALSTIATRSLYVRWDGRMTAKSTT